jgi:hypothetical protein
MIITNWNGSRTVRPPRKGAHAALRGLLLLRPLEEMHETCENSLMPVFSLNHTVVLVRHAGTSQEARQEVIAGGLLDTEALFYKEVGIKRGDIIEAELLDEPRFVVSVHPQMTMDGISHYKAKLMPLSVWHERQAALNRQPIQQTVYGTVGNLAAITGGAHVSITQKQIGAELGKVAEILNEMQTFVQRSPEFDDDVKADYAVDVDQLKGELQRPKKDSSRIWTLVDRLSKVGGAGKLVELLWQHRQALDPLLRSLGL